MNSLLAPNGLSSRTEISRLRCLVASLALTAVGLLFGGCTTYSPQGNMELFVRAAPAPSLAKPGKEFTSAQAHAAQDERSFALIGSGKSMEPMDESGAAMVENEQSDPALRGGRPLVDRNRRGYDVAQMIVEPMSGGWLTRGVQNAPRDAERACKDNYVGVIQAAYAATDTPLRADVAARVALKDDIDRSVKMALLR